MFASRLKTRKTKKKKPHKIYDECGFTETRIFITTIKSAIRILEEYSILKTRRNSEMYFR